MKNKTKILAIFLLSITIISMGSSVLVFALGNDKGVITNTESLPKGRAIVRLESPTIASLEFSSTLPGQFNYEDVFGNALTATDTVPDTSEAELFYPVRQDISNQWYYDDLNQFNTFYATVENNSEVFGDYDVTVNSKPYDLRLGGDDSIIYPTDLVSLIQIKARKSGIYQLWLSDLTYTPGNVIILGPNGENIEFYNDQLPDNQRLSGVTLGKYICFAAFATGTYRIYLPTSDAKIKIRCEYLNPQTINMNSEIDVGPDPFSTSFMNPEYSCNVYSVKVRDLNKFYSYFYDIEYGAPIDKIFYNLGEQTQIVNFNEGFNQILPMITRGKVFIVIDNPDYFIWADDGIQESKPVKYSMLFKEISAEKHKPNTKETIAVSKSEGAVAKKIKIEDTSILCLEHVDIGSNSPNLYSRANKIVFKNRDGIAYYPETQEVIDPYGGMSYYVILAEPGTYFCAFMHSNSETTEYMEFSSKVIPISNTNVLSKDADENIPESQFTDITLEDWKNMPEGTDQGQCYGNGLEFTAGTDFWNWEYNLTLNAEDNAHIFDENEVLDLGIMWDDQLNDFFNYTEGIQPGNDTLVPFTAQTYGDAFIIGCEEKWYSMDLEILSPATANIYYWQYWQGSGWETFSTSDGFLDGTHNGTHSLEINGTISWDPGTGDMNNWAFYNGGENTGTEVPDTGGRDLYLIRCICYGSSFPIPEVRQITNVKKYIRIRFDLDTWVSFDTDDRDRKVAYCEVDDTTWNNQYFGNGQGKWTVVDNTNSMRFNFEERGAIFSIALADLIIYDFKGNAAGNAHRLNDSLTWSVAIYRTVGNSQIINYDVGENVATKYSKDQNLTELPTDYSFSVNASELNYVYIGITPRNTYDWSQINLKVVNGTVTGANLIFPAHYSYDTINTLINTYGSGIFDIDSDFVEYYASGGLPEFDYNMSMEFGFVSDLIYLELAVTTAVPENLTLIHVEVNQFDLNMIIIGEPGFPVWAIVLIVVGGIAVACVVGWFIYKKNNPGARIDLSKITSKLKLKRR
ncbi:MAG: hypothetical protein GF364_02590 [Candidatus Lokiarchaeota archaeon]|nr:hypothetical protein [Candidatus Lokiarchaeota archaeon]